MTNTLDNLTREQLINHTARIESELDELRRSIPVEAMKSARHSGVALSPVKDMLESLGLDVPPSRVAFTLEISVDVVAEVMDPSHLSEGWIADSVNLDESYIESAIGLDGDWDTDREYSIDVTGHDVVSYRAID